MNSEETRKILHVDDFDTRILFYRMREVLTVPDRPATNQRSRVWGKGGTTHGRRTNHQRLTSNQPAIPCVGKGRNHTREDEPPASDQQPTSDHQPASDQHPTSNPVCGKRKNHTREDQRASDQRPTSNQPTSNQPTSINSSMTY